MVFFRNYFQVKRSSFKIACSDQLRFAEQLVKEIVYEVMYTVIMFIEHCITPAQSSPPAVQAMIDWNFASLYDIRVAVIWVMGACSTKECRIKRKCFKLRKRRNSFSLLPHPLNATLVFGICNYKH